MNLGRRSRPIRFSLRMLLLAIALISVDAGICRLLERAQRYVAVRDLYGGRRMTRAEAVALRGDEKSVNLLPDSEFLKD
jgi:hypothetical protein